MPQQSMMIYELLRKSASSKFSEVFAVLIEIPRADKERYLVFQQRNGRYDLIDDFVHDKVPYPAAIRAEDGAYVYYSQAKELFRRPSGYLAQH